MKAKTAGKIATKIVLLDAKDALIRLLEYWPDEKPNGMFRCPYCGEEGATADDIRHDPGANEDDPLFYDPECAVLSAERAVADIEALGY